jgi:hypothetical protein
MVVGSDSHLIEAATQATQRGGPLLGEGYRGTTVRNG